MTAGELETGPRHHQRGDAAPPREHTPPASTRDRIVLAAVRLFAEHGYAATGVSAILKAAGVRSGSLYYFFTSKEEVLSAVLDWYLDNLQAEIIGPAEAQTPDPIERVFSLLDLYRSFLMMTGCRMGCPIGNLALEVSDTHERARLKILENFDNWCAAVRRWLEAAGDRLPADVDREALSRFVLTVMEGGQMQAKAQKRLDGFDASVRQLRDYINRLQEQAKAERGR